MPLGERIGMYSNGGRGMGEGKREIEDRKMSGC
jgi:hypothetical protein